MSQETVLYQELEKLDLNEIKKIASLWNIQKIPGKDKKSTILGLMEIFQNEFYLKGVLEKFTPLQVNILTSILKNKGVMTLGEISRKVNIPPINVEMELNVLRKYYLLYQRKNRERLTNNLDKYHTYDEYLKLIKVETNPKGEKFKFSIEKALHKSTLAELPEEWKEAVGAKKGEHIETFLKNALEQEFLQKLIEGLSDFDKDILHQIYIHGGVIEADTIRNYITVNRGKFEQTIPHLTSLYLVRDLYYVEDKFIRVIVIPKEILDHLQFAPILPPVKKGTRVRQEKISANGLDFFLNVKKLISYISRKGLNLAKSGKIKQADHKRTETELLSPDIEIFSEKSQVYQIELILPILKLLGYVDIKGENVILIQETDEFLKKDIFEIMKLVIHEVNEARTRRLNPPEVFTATEVPFYEKGILDKTVKLIMAHGKINTSVIFSHIIRDHLVFSPTFQIKTYEEDLADLRKEIISAIFYLQLFGLIEVEYPQRNLSLSELGAHYFNHEALVTATEKGGITINPDFSIIAFPDRVSLHGIHLLKAFCELKDYDRVYTFLLTKDSFQLGILLGYDKETFIHFLRESSKADLAQNLLFLLDDWGNNLPIVTITEDSVLLRTKDSQVMELLLGQIKGKKFVLEEVSPTGIIIEKSKVMEVIAIAEKLNMIIRLNR
ncbi:helicase [Leptospira bourretii]|uniref:Helicase n=1 Tax=Leptospira bourretii TaxID=2484962 RepID=A0A4V3JLF8_9LEPT|nr:helicase [Leptospira bourretii]TGK85424.1 helicase [Leptospira bourretii]TGK92653.1 helicase [Leptospira bourretii]TGL24675.1 helicase [Leptospira bourretii]TGL28578.1 helicase [Leptospira bourretii]